MIENAALSSILDTATDISVVAEIYGADATPGDDGFDPNDALDCYATTGIEFMGVTYKKLIRKFGNVNRKISGESNTASVDFSNLNGVISEFEFTNGFEGLIMVIRLISRSISVDQDTSQILFTGRCEKPQSGNKESLNVTATWILGGLEVIIPRRKYTRDDQEGRVSSDPEFEGFLFIPQYGTTSYSVRVPRGGFFGALFHLKKWVTKTFQYSSYSDLDATKPVPEVFGRSQLLASHIAYEDVGTNLHIRSAFCEGPIEGFENVRSTNDLLPLSGTNYDETLGLVGAANNIGPSWVGPGNYSRTASIIGQCDNSDVQTIEPAPDIAGVVLGRLMTIPDAGAWTDEDNWTDNPAAHTYFVLTSDDYYKLDADWIEEPDFTESYDFNDELIIDRSLTDFIFVEQG